ncbi:MAG: O-antigen ligase family protein [Chloroflexi bacterium]|nr:O-antigen ligase family protein [Chloroflexota bacterium]
MTRLQNIFINEDRRLAALAAGLMLGLLAGLTALALVALGPLVTFIGLVAIVIGLAALTNLDLALILLLNMIALLPFGTLPFELALTLSLIDAALGLFLVVYLFQWMTGERRDLQVTPAHAMILIFVMVMVFAFVRGIPNAPLTPGVLRRFVALMANIVMALVIVDVVRNVGMLRRLVLTVISIGAVSALVGIVLWFMSDDLANDVLTRLSRIGYPGGDVLRYREDGVRIGIERAIGTWVDPNAFGGFLMMVGALTAPQVLARRPVTGRYWLAAGLFGVIMLALFLTDSRGSMLGFVAGTGVVAVIRYRKLIWVGLFFMVIAFFLPPTQEYIGRLIAGVQGEDLATQMRFGEYRDALRLIQRYPLLGVGFSGTPDIDLYLAVASTYLTIMGNAGLVGLISYLLALGSVLWYAYRNRHAVLGDDDINDIALGLLAGIIGALIGGVFDHFYFNIEFQATSLTLWLYIGFFLASVRLAMVEHFD